MFLLFLNFAKKIFKSYINIVGDAKRSSIVKVTRVTMEATMLQLISIHLF